MVTAEIITKYVLTDTYIMFLLPFLGIRFFDQSSTDVQNIIKEVNQKISELSEGNIEEAISDRGLGFNLALMYDAVLLYTSALNAIGIEKSANITCENKETWNFGSSVVNFVRTVSKHIKNILY